MRGASRVVDLLPFVANGVAVGSILLLAAAGLSLLFGVKRFANFAHGDLMALGAYACYAAWVQAGWGLAAGIGVALLVVPLAGMALEWSLFARLRSRPPAVLLMASVGVSFALQNVLKVVWGTRDHSFPRPAETVVALGWGVALTPTKLLLIALAAGAALGLHLLLTRTKLGKAMRATADNHDLARITGIPTRRVELAAWALSGALAAAGGIALGAVGVLTPDMGFHQLLLIFAAVILGGIGSPYGAMLGAMVVGIAMEFSKPLLQQQGIAPTLSPAVAFAILVAMLLLRPEGLMGTARARGPAWARRRVARG